MASKNKSRKSSESSEEEEANLTFVTVHFPRLPPEELTGVEIEQWMRRFDEYRNRVNEIPGAVARTAADGIKLMLG